MDSDIESYVHNCDNCQKMPAVPPLADVHQREWPGKPRIRIYVDFTGPIKGQMYLIVIGYKSYPQIQRLFKSQSEHFERSCLDWVYH